MDINTESSLRANGLSQIEVLVLRNELFALRDRVANLERQLSDIKQCKCTDGCRFEETCAFCRDKHPIWQCEYFRYLTVKDRWRTAKELKLCYRCLNDKPKHLGRDCPYSKMCAINHCRMTHNPLLHDAERRKNQRRAKPQVQSGDTGPSEPSGGNIVLPGAIGSDVTQKMSGNENESLTVREHGESAHSSMDELNRLAMLGEEEIWAFFENTGSEPFNELDPHAGTAVVCDRKTDQEKMAENNSIGSINSLDSSNDNLVRHPNAIEVHAEVHAEDPESISFSCQKDSIDSENMVELNRLAMLAETDVKVPFDLIFGGSCGKELGSSQSRSLISNSFVKPSGDSLENVPIPPMENENIRFAPDGIDINARLYDAGMFYNKCIMPEDHQKRTKEKTEEKYLEIPSNVKSHHNTDKLDSFDDQRKPSGGELKDSDLLNIKLHTLDKEIQCYEDAITTSAAPPAEEFNSMHEKQNSLDKSETDLSVWLMPIPDQGGS